MHGLTPTLEKKAYYGGEYETHNAVVSFERLRGGKLAADIEKKEEVKTQLFVPDFGGMSDLATLYTKM